MKKRGATKRMPQAELVDPKRALIERFRPDADEIHAKSVKRFRADLKILRHNLARGLEAVFAHEARIRQALPEVRLEDLRSLMDLCFALGFAADDAREARRSPGELPELLTEARTLRKLMLTSAEGLALAGVVDKYWISQIRRGNGPYDTAMDCMELADLFETHKDAIAGQSPITRDHVRRALELGEELHTRLTPMKAMPRPKAETLHAIELRDRLYTLLVMRHEELWKVGAYLFGFAVEAHVPLLQTRRITRKARPPALVASSPPEEP